MAYLCLYQQLFSVSLICMHTSNNPFRQYTIAAGCRWIKTLFLDLRHPRACYYFGEYVHTKLFSFITGRIYYDTANKMSYKHTHTQVNAVFMALALQTLMRVKKSQQQKANSKIRKD
jgi:hypothetical protein